MVFVPYTVPGDCVEVEVTGEKRGFLEGRVQRLITPSPDRAEPFCALFGRCGGCQWQHIPYRDQVAWKERIFRESLERIGGIKGLPLERAVVAETERGYRTRAQFHVQNGRWGFFAAASNDVVELDECPLLDPFLNRSFNAVRDALVVQAPELPLHTVEVGVSDDDQKIVALLHVREKVRLDLDRLMDSVPDLKGVELRLTPLGRRGGRPLASIGDGCLTYRVSGLMMRCHLSAFSQVNLGQNERLVDTVLDFADPRDRDSVVDLFSGAGNLSIPLAERCKSVIAIERDGVAIRDGILNSEAKEMGYEPYDLTDWPGVLAAAWVQSVRVSFHTPVCLTVIALKTTNTIKTDTTAARREYFGRPLSKAREARRATRREGARDGR